MSGIVYLIVMLISTLVAMIGAAFVIVSLASIHTRRAFFGQIGSTLLAYVLTTIVLFVVLFASKNEIIVAGRSAEGGITEIPMVARLGLGAPFWSMLCTAVALRVLFSKSSLKNALSSGVLLATATFNFFIIFYAQKILDTMSISSGSMLHWRF